MRTYNPVRPHIADITAFAMNLRLWLLELVGMFAGWSGMRAMKLRVREEMRYLRRDLKRVLYLLAFARFDLKPHAKRTWRPPSVARGFRVTRRCTRLVKHFTRDLDLSTPAAMRAVLDDLESTIKRIAKRVRWACAAWRRISVAPPATSCADVRETCAPCCADTS
ncbi:MAG: hypothetical protein FD124_2006 [Alphaproteobacteria bacterium]|nr:MAG: hypothetical protein FD160_3377 [Caulobacteraceae bacterium]TPW05801.1 MAG: hypothetical protein FD124_2006 [Alphaproteobacteria bacterium]